MYCMIFKQNYTTDAVLFTTLARWWYSNEVIGRPKHVLLTIRKKGHCILLLSEECINHLLTTTQNK